MHTSPAANARSLRNLYLVRTAFQAVWAVGLLRSGQPLLATCLLVAYPLWDVLCTVYDLRTSGAEGSTRNSQLLNAALGVVAALGIAATVSHNTRAAIATFGGWALAAGLLQLVAGLLRRRQLGGQWAMMLSGAQSTAAGIAFILGGLAGKLTSKNLAGYAIFGALYFLIAGLLLTRKLASASSDPLPSRV